MDRSCDSNSLQNKLEIIKPLTSGGFFFLTLSLYLRSIINHKSIKMKKILLLAFLISLTINAQEKKDYFIHLTSDPMKNPSAAMMSIAAASEALKQKHSVVFFAAGDGTKILIKDVINNLHTVTSLGRGVSGDSNKISQMLKKAIIEFSNNGGIIHISEGSILTYGVTQKNYKEHLIDVKKINWSYPKELIEESSKADIVFSY